MSQSNRKVYRIKLTSEERVEFESVLRGRRGKLEVARWKLQRSNAMLQCDEGEQGPAWSDIQIAEACGVSIRSIENWRRQAFENGPLSLLERKKRLTPPTSPILDGEKEAQLVKLACSQAPDGRSRWTLQLLADKLVELEVVSSISTSTICRVQKKPTQAMAKVDVVHSP